MSEFYTPKPPWLHYFNVHFNPITPLYEAITGTTLSSFGINEISTSDRVDRLASFVIACIGKEGGGEISGLGSAAKGETTGLRSMTEVELKAI